VIDLSSRDIGYRIWVLTGQTTREWDPVIRISTPTDQPHWFVQHSSYGGLRGVFDDIDGAKNSARSNGIKKGTYEIWKFHMGRPDSSIPWFPPEKVYG
jgi:hypothetical protein